MSTLDANTLRRVADLLDDTPTPTALTGGEVPFSGPVLIRTVTHYYTGRVVACTGGFVVLDAAAWIADTGRFSDALASGTLNEVEPYPGQCAVSLGAIVDVCPWDHDLPRSRK